MQRGSGTEQDGAAQVAGGLRVFQGGGSTGESQQEGGQLGTGYGICTVERSGRGGLGSQSLQAQGAKGFTECRGWRALQITLGPIPVRFRLRLGPPVHGAGVPRRRALPGLKRSAPGQTTCTPGTSSTLRAGASASNAAPVSYIGPNVLHTSPGDTLLLLLSLLRLLRILRPQHLPARCPPGSPAHTTTWPRCSSTHRTTPSATCSPQKHSASTR